MAQNNVSKLCNSTLTEKIKISRLLPESTTSKYSNIIFVLLFWERLAGEVWEPFFLPPMIQRSNNKPTFLGTNYIKQWIQNCI
jgi:hypothetical protein